MTLNIYVKYNYFTNIIICFSLTKILNNYYSYTNEIVILYYLKYFYKYGFEKISTISKGYLNINLLEIKYFNGISNTSIYNSLQH